MVSYKDKIITFPLFNTCYLQNLARNLARRYNLFRQIWIRILGYWLLILQFLQYILWFFFRRDLKTCCFSGFWIFMLFDKFIKITKDKFYIFIMVYQLLFNFFYFKSNTQIIRQYLPYLGKYSHYLDIYSYSSFAMQHT
jgi:hypothetical protein